jgi:predicted ATPase/DNA-binding CsgD family transcriptional regulator/transcriptional regulator with XRE-family HTH domain
MYAAHDFRSWMRHIRAEQDLTQEALAERVGCSVETIRAFEAERRRPSRAMAERLADVLLLPSEQRAAFLRLARSFAEHAPATPPAPLPEAQLAAAPPPPLPRLAAPPTAFIGRDAELASVIERLRDPACRLLTIVGPGGIGKTRLALQAALAWQSETNGEAAMVLLAQVGALEHVAPAIAEALGIALPPRLAPEAGLLHKLRDRSFLLILDNMEHLLDSAPLLSSIMRDAPGVRLLATSRERLRLSSEWVFELKGLSLPRNDTRAAIDRSDAVHLFAERVRQLAAEPALGSANLQAIAHICRQLGGSPLGIELAASWCRALSPNEIAADLTRGLDILSRTDRDADPRHRSMRVVFEQSWALLSSEEHHALARMSVFRGGGDRQAVTNVAQTSLVTLTELLDKSLLRREESGGATRYTLHELVRQFAAEKLAGDPGDQRATEQRHMNFYAEYLQSAFLPSADTTTAPWRRVQTDMDNIHAAWSLAVDTRNAATLQAMVRGLMTLFDAQGAGQEGIVLLERAAEALKADAAAVGARGRILGWLGYLLFRASRKDEAAARVQEGLALMQDHGGAIGLADLLHNLAWFDFFAANLVAARDQWARAERVAIVSGDEFVRLWATIMVQTAETFLGNYAAAEPATLAALADWRRLKLNRGITSSLSTLSEIVRLGGRNSEAERYAREALHLGIEGQDPMMVAWALRELGLVAYEQGDLDEARYLLSESCEGMRAIGERWLYGRSRAPLAWVEVRRGDLLNARRGCKELIQLVNSGEALLVLDAGYAVALVLRAEGRAGDAQAILDQLDGVAGEPQTAQLIDALALRPQPAPRHGPLSPAAQQALMDMLERQLDAPPAAAIPSAQAVTPGGLFIPETGETLSPREADVLRLLVTGASNQHVADTLVISLHTAKTHVANILQKLRVATRTQAALRGRALGLGADDNSASALPAQRLGDGE